MSAARLMYVSRSPVRTDMSIIDKFLRMVLSYLIIPSGLLIFNTCFPQAEVSFSPTMPTSSSEAKNILPAVAGSLKMTIPTITAPSAPMPVHMP